LGTEGEKLLVRGLSMSRGKKLSKYFITYDPNSEINIVMPVSG
jgi:hypothetical protein